VLLLEMLMVLLLGMCLVLIVTALNLLANIMPGLDKLINKKLFLFRCIKRQQQVHLKLILILIVLHHCIVVQQQHAQLPLHVLWLLLKYQVDLVHLLGSYTEVG
jgi:hypothetical protein